MNNDVIEKAKRLGMYRHEYEDGFYYVTHYSVSPYGIKQAKHESDTLTLEFQEDLSYAQLVKPDLYFREITVEECLSLVEKLNEITEYLY